MGKIVNLVPNATQPDTNSLDDVVNELYKYCEDVLDRQCKYGILIVPDKNGVPLVVKTGGVHCTLTDMLGTIELAKAIIIDAYSNLKT